MTEPAEHDGTGRVELSFTVLDADPERTVQRQVRVPPGVTVFDSASWNGIAIDSTCGGHGTCHKCKVQVEGRLPDHPARPEDLHPRPARRWLAAGLPGQRDPRPRRRRPPAHHPPQGGDRRRRPAGDPAARDPEEVRRARGADAGRPAHRPRPAARRDRRPRAGRRPARAAPAADGAAVRRLQGHGGDRRRGADRRRAGRHDEDAVRDRLRPRDDDRRRHPARRRDRHAGRRGVDAQQAAALRRRRDHPDQRGDDGPRHARPAAARCCGNPVHAGDPGLHRGLASTRRTSTRWPSPATPR